MGVETTLGSSHAATPALIVDRELSFSLSSVSRRKVSAVSDGGRLLSDNGVMLLGLLECRRNIAATLVNWRVAQAPTS
jgi:hypothetical protein